MRVFPSLVLACGEAGNRVTGFFQQVNSWRPASARQLVRTVLVATKQPVDIRPNLLVPGSESIHLYDPLGSRPLSAVLREALQIMLDDRLLSEARRAAYEAEIPVYEDRRSPHAYLVADLGEDGLPALEDMLVELARASGRPVMVIGLLPLAFEAEAGKRATSRLEAIQRLVGRPLEPWSLPVVAGVLLASRELQGGELIPAEDLYGAAAVLLDLLTHTTLLSEPQIKKSLPAPGVAGADRVCFGAFGLRVRLHPVWDLRTKLVRSTVQSMFDRLQGLEDLAAVARRVVDQLRSHADSAALVAAGEDVVARRSATLHAQPELEASNPAAWPARLAAWEGTLRHEWLRNLATDLKGMYGARREKCLGDLERAQEAQASERVDGVAVVEAVFMQLGGELNAATNALRVPDKPPDLQVYRAKIDKAVQSRPRPVSLAIHRGLFALLAWYAAAVLVPQPQWLLLPAGLTVLLILEMLLRVWLSSLRLGSLTRNYLEALPEAFHLAALGVVREAVRDHLTCCLEALDARRKELTVRRALFAKAAALAATLQDPWETPQGSSILQVEALGQEEAECERQLKAQLDSGDQLPATGGEAVQPGELVETMVRWAAPLVDRHLSSTVVATLHEQQPLRPPDVTPSLFLRLPEIDPRTGNPVYPIEAAVGEDSRSRFTGPHVFVNSETPFLTVALKLASGFTADAVPLLREYPVAEAAQEQGEATT